jgi:hypothetical protein
LCFQEVFPGLGTFAGFKSKYQSPGAVLIENRPESGFQLGIIFKKSLSLFSGSLRPFPAAPVRRAGQIYATGLAEVLVQPPLFHVPEIVTARPPKTDNLRLEPAMSVEYGLHSAVFVSSVSKSPKVTLPSPDTIDGTAPVVVGIGKTDNVYARYAGRIGKHFGLLHRLKC